VRSVTSERGVSGVCLGSLKKIGEIDRHSKTLSFHCGLRPLDPWRPLKLVQSESNAELHALRKAIDQKRREVGGVEAVVLDQLSMEAEREEIDREEQAERDKRREEKKHKNAK